MGHTVWSQRQNLDIILAELHNYGKALRPLDRARYLALLKEPLKHVGSISYASSMHAWAFILISIILEQDKKIAELSHERLADGRVPEREHYRTLD